VLASPRDGPYNDSGARPQEMVIREDALIERIRRHLPAATGGGLRTGIGDDAAVLRPSPSQDWILSCDQFIENVHFLARAHPPEAVGYKALARATSDLAAMGARPRFFLLSLELPAQRTGRWLDGLLAGMARAARRFGLILAGGDTACSTGSQARAALNITVLGTVAAGRAVLREGAQPGDAIFVTGRLGAAQLGLELILRGLDRRRRWRQLLMAQFFPAIHVELGRWLAAGRLASAMMDLSDGLSIDLHRLCRASGVSARVEEGAIPCIVVPEALRALGLNALSMALHGGEDYALLFTVPRRHLPRIPRAFRRTPLARIGEIVRGRGVQLVRADGRASPLAPLGWDHFGKRLG
jgi:thiamine-monophosphate kinase